MTCCKVQIWLEACVPVWGPVSMSRAKAARAPKTDELTQYHSRMGRLERLLQMV